jgi:hypothetical protein
MQQKDEELVKMITDEDKFKRYSVPVCAFITFESDNAYNIAIETEEFKPRGMFTKAYQDCRSQNQTRHEVLGSRACFIAATEPTNIIWEHRHIKGWSLYGRIFSCFLVILLMLSITFGGIIYFKKDQLNNLSTYADIDCSTYQNSVKENLGSGAILEDKLRQYAVSEYDSIEIIKKKNPNALVK